MTQVTVTFGGRTETAERRGDDTILETARSRGIPVQTSCEAGHCATCMALVVEGRVEMRMNDALDADEVAEGWVLTCQAVPVTDVVRVEYP